MANLPEGWLSAGLERAAAERQGLIEALGLAVRERDRARILAGQETVARREAERELDTIRRLIAGELVDPAEHESGAVYGLRATLGALDRAEQDRDALRTELRAREWLDETGLAVIACPGLIFVGLVDGVAFAYASYTSAARACGWEG